MDDNSILQEGIHKGKKLIDVPAQYLLNLYDYYRKDLPLDLIEYIEDNIEVLYNEIKPENQLRKLIKNG